MAASGEDGGPRVGVVIVAYQSKPHLQRCVDALAAQTFQDFEIIIWDNASTDGALEGLRAPANARVHAHGENLGFAAGNNRAAALTQAPYLALLNPDAFPEPDWLEHLVAVLDARADVAAVASLQLDDAEPDRLDGAGDVYHGFGIPYRGGYGAPRPPVLQAGAVFAPCAAAALYRREAFDAIGGFDEAYFCYCEDVDLGFRLRAAGWSAWFEPRAVVRHVGSASAGLRSPFAIKHGVRNRLWTYVKNMPLSLMLLTAWAHVAMTLGLWARDVVRDPAAARATAKGLREGLADLPRVWRQRSGEAARRRASTLELARAMTWSPLKLLRRAPDVRSGVRS